MAITSINAHALRDLLLHVADRIQASEAELNAFDSAIGDGDHGITMRIGFQAVRKRIAQLPDDASPERVLTEAGRAFMRNTGGAIGVVLGRALEGGGVAVAGTSELGPGEVRKLFAAMEAAVAETGKAKPGDKTMLDPMHAVTEALAQAPDDVPQMLSLAAGAADSAARNTAGMLCRVGRASRLGERVLGHPDPGAMSFALIVAALAECVRNLPQATQAVHG
jgi:dihydroxyacetone kinase phosphoprotein-dependent L subunit